MSPFSFPTIPFIVGHMKHTLLRRYTDLPPLLHLLKSKKLTLLSPKSWDDRNDSYYLEVYKRKRKLQSVLALCFTEGSETYHHWRVFSGGSSGICIEFNKALLLSTLNGTTGIRSKEVIYRKLKELRAAAPNINDLPFLKRYPFRDEKEFRIIYEDKEREMETKDFDIDVHAISKIIMNPWMPKALFKTVKELIRDIDGCVDIEVTRTTLVDNEEWKRLGVTKGET